MRIAVLRRLAALAITVVVLAGCVFTFDTLGSTTQEVPVNTGPRQDLVVENVTREHGVSSDSQVRALIRSSWASSAELRSWFQMTEIIGDLGETTFLSTHVGAMQSTSRRAGNAKYGFYTIREVQTRVTFELIDASSGIVLASAESIGRDTKTDARPSSERALSRAIDNGLRLLIRNYSGA